MTYRRVNYPPARILTAGLVAAAVLLGEPRLALATAQAPPPIEESGVVSVMLWHNNQTGILRYAEA